ncbi:hypothetical protein KY284_012691 [Solanum tuberosum]|nr:hypothetical protein KY284_012691 [Solanum tuberosum]
MSKTIAEAIQLLDEISENAAQWPSNRVIIKKAVRINQVEALNSLTQQITALTQKFEAFQRATELSTVPTTTSDKSTNIEYLLNKHLKATNELINKHIRVTNEKVSQIATLVSGQIQGALPRNTEKNSKEHLKAISLRSVLEMEENIEVPLILGRPFLATGRAIIDVHQGQLILRVNEERDLRSDYWEVRIAEGDESKTTSLTRYGMELLTSLSCPLAPATFCRLMNQVVRD